MVNMCLLSPYPVFLCTCTLMIICKRRIPVKFGSVNNKERVHWGFYPGCQLSTKHTPCSSLSRFITPYRALLSFKNISPITVQYVNNFLELTPWVSTKPTMYQSISDNSLRLWVSGLCLPLLDCSLNLLFVMIYIKKFNYMHSTYTTCTCKKQYTCISLAESICNSCMDNSEIARYLHFIV